MNKTANCTDISTAVPRQKDLSDIGSLVSVSTNHLQRLNGAMSLKSFCRGTGRTAEYCNVQEKEINLFGVLFAISS